MDQLSEHWQLKSDALDLIPGSCLDFSSFSKLPDVLSVLPFVVL